ncbi:MAG: T9SS type A sorting domain-containing protein [Ignavibacteriaceae bacterium]
MKLKLVTIMFVLAIAANFSFAQDFYLGTGTPSDPQGTSCASCHSTVNNGIAKLTYYDSWKLTKHAQAYDSLSGILSYSCLQCHTTGWDASVTNGGADEYVKADTSAPHGYTITNATGFNRTKNVGCEDCHGPLGDSTGNLSVDHWGFFGNGTTNVPSVAADVCGRCHSGSHNPYLDEWNLSKHAISTSSSATITNVVLKNKSCVRCHVAQNFILYMQNPTAYRDTILVTGNNIQPLTCAACHDPHSDANPKQLRMSVTNKAVICDACHSVYLDSVNVNTAVHEDNGPALDGTTTFGYRYPGQTYSNSAHTFAATQRCITCHVYASTTGGTNTGHTFEPRVQACAQCHSDYFTNVDTSNAAKRFDYDGVQTTTDSLMAVLQAKLNKASHSDSATASFKEANYNLGAVSGDGSHGVHNTRLEQKLLTDAIANFTPTGTTGVKDVNNLPTTYSISQNYPNPFNPTTTIDFTLPEASNVKITVYDALGKQVTTLVNSFLNRGNYKATWNADSYSSGVYFYRIEAKNFLMVKKMVLLK